MRILHFSDLHVGVETFGRPAGEADIEALPPSFAPGVRRQTYLGLSTRLIDFLAAFDRIVDYATREQVDLVLFAGDAYKSRDPSQTHQREFARRVATLASRGIPMFLVTGNHDLSHAPGRATALEIFPTLDVPLVHVAEGLGTYRVETRSGPLQIVAVPWIRRGAWLTRPDLLGASVDEVTRSVEREVAERVQHEAAQLDPAVPAVLVAHATVAGAVTSSERSMMLGRDYVLQRSSVALPAFDYVALGHIHKHQVLGHHPPVVYSGSLQPVDFSEEDDVKGFCLVEIDPTLPQGERARWELVPVDARPMVTIRVTVPPDAEDPTALVTRTIARRHIVGAIVRVHVTVPAELAPQLNERTVREALQDAHAVAAVTREVVQERPTRLGQKAQGMGPIDALRWYLESRGNLPEPSEQRAMEWGTRLIEEELGGGTAAGGP